MEKALKSCQTATVGTEFLLKMMKLVLAGNIFVFDGQMYKQQIGTAMGTRLAPSYACLFMAWLEENVLLSSWKGIQPKLWRRYIDDIIFIWESSEQELLAFIDHLNSQHDLIKFKCTYNISTRSVPFLDMMVSIDNNNMIQTDLYKKDTAVVQYLLPSSCHPHHITANIPYSLAYRLLRICSMPEQFQQRLEELKNDLLSREYKPKIIEDAFKRIGKITREEALKRVEGWKGERVPLVVTYHPCLPSVSGVVRKHWSVMIEDNPRLKRCFPSPPIVAYRRSKNLRDMLIRAKLPPMVKTSKRQADRKIGFRSCSWQCPVCPFAKETQQHTNSKTGQSWKICSPLDCQSKNIIYKISCEKCDFVYIGETRRRLQDRAAEHKGYVTRPVLSQPVGEHFNSRGHSLADMCVTAIEQVLPMGDTLLRRQREHLWINRYGAIEQGGNRGR